MLNIRLAVSEFGDWYGLYMNKELKYQNHNISIEEFIDMLSEDFEEINGIDYDEIEITEDEMMYFKNELPNQYEDIVKLKQNNM